VLEFVRVREMTAWVKPAPSRAGVVPRWMGAKMALSTLLAERTRKLIAEAKHGRYASPELKLVRPLLELQKRWSALPDTREWLIERFKGREGHYLFFYPFVGRLAHMGLATLFGYRLSRVAPRTFSMTVNDYGFGLLSPEPVDLSVATLGALLAAPHVEHDILLGVNAAEMARRGFREIARVAGLVFQGYPGQGQSARQLQASSSLLYDVFNDYDPDNLLLQQSLREVLDRRLEAPRLEAALDRMRRDRVVIIDVARPTPFAFPLMVEIFREKLTTEALATRVARMVADLEKIAGA
jgi:ATP-dependent Lhr-like helicase